MQYLIGCIFPLNESVWPALAPFLGYFPSFSALSWPQCFWPKASLHRKREITAESVPSFPHRRAAAPFYKDQKELPSEFSQCRQVILLANQCWDGDMVSKWRGRQDKSSCHMMDLTFLNQEQKTLSSFQTKRMQCMKNFICSFVNCLG